MAKKESASKSGGDGGPASRGSSSENRQVAQERRNKNRTVISGMKIVLHLKSTS